MRRPHDRKITVIERGNSSGAHPLGYGHDGGVDEPEAQVVVGVREVGSPRVIRVCQIHNLEGSVYDGVEKAHLVFRSEPASKHPAGFGHDRSRDNEPFFGTEQVTACSVLRFVAAARLEQHARVDDKHSDLAETS